LVKVLYPTEGAPAAGVSEVQIITVGADAVPHYLKFRGRQTASKLAVDASAATVQSALRALSSIGGTNVSVSGSAGGPYTATFSGDLAEQDLPLIQSSSSKVSVVRSVVGSRPTGYGLGTGALLVTDEPAMYQNNGDDEDPDWATVQQAAVGSDGLGVLGVARATFDPSANSGQRTIGAHGLGVTIPDNAIIVGGFYETLTTLTSATDAATLALHVQSANDIKSAIAISNGANPWDAGLGAIIPKANTPESTGIKLTAAREITATVAVEALTAGKVTVFIYYVVGD
jgi:hypothetical protein